MILGEYSSADSEVTLEITVGNGVRNVVLTAVLDTGFTDYLMITQSVADDLQLPITGSDTVGLGDGSISRLPVCEAQIEWHGKVRTVRTYVTRRADPLIGMKLLRGSLVTLELVPGGSITVEGAG